MSIRSTIQNRTNHQLFIQVQRSIMQYLDGRGYSQLDLPALLPALIPESYLEVFETEYRYFDTRQKLYLTPSPELLIKRLLVDGIGDCYYLGKSYRNSEPTSSKHLGEFTMLELYKVQADYMDIAAEVLALLQHIKYQISGVKEDLKLTYQGVEVDLSRWEQMTVAAAFKKYAGISEQELFDQDLFRTAAKRKGYVTEMNNEQLKMNNEKVAGGTQFGYADLWSQIYATEVEPHLGCHGYPTLLYDYPVEFAALSTPNPDGKTAQRFEFYIAGVELGNCYSELADWSLQEQRLQKEQQERTKSGKITHPADDGFVEALKLGLPKCSGIAIGVDRLAMIYADVDSIEKLRLISF